MSIRSIFLSSFILFSALSSTAQEWKKQMAKGAPYHQIVSSFNTEWGNKRYEKHQGFKPFYRFKTFWENRLDRQGHYISRQTIMSNHDNYMASFALPAATGNEDAGFWRTEGPFDHTNTDSWSHGQGRVNVVVEDPNDINTIYVGAPDGGLWRSSDAGSTWEPLIDNFSRLGISDIVIDFDNSQNIYIATGDADGGDAPAIGIWKSTDGGLTWAESGDINASKIYKIEMDPDNAQRLVAATNSGIFRTEDGGTSWIEVYADAARDIQFAKGQNNPLVFALSLNDNELYRSTDHGATWNNIVIDAGLDFGPSRLDVTPADSTVVYVVASADDNQYAGTYKSSDAGLTFNQVHNIATDDLYNGSGQSWYDLDIAVSETDANTLMVGVLNLWRSVDGGLSWTQINNWSTTTQASYTHADIHFLKWHGNHLYCGSDGGIYKSTNNGDVFTDLTAGLPIGQFYDLDVFEDDPSYMAGGLQDNGGYYYDGAWKNYYGADGMTQVFNAEDSSQVYGMIQNGNLYRSSNFGQTNQGLGNPMDGAWVTPMEWDKAGEQVVAGFNQLYTYTDAGGWTAISTTVFPSNLKYIELYKGELDTLVFADNSNLYRSTDGGVTETDLTANLPVGFFGSIQDIELDDTDAQHFFVLKANAVFETTDGGTSFTNLTDNLPSTHFNDIEMDQSQTNKSLYLATDVAVHYYNTTIDDWVPYNTNLPAVVVTDIEILEDFDAVRIATYGRGIYASRLADQIIHKHDAQLLSAGFGVDTLCSAADLELNYEFKNRAWDTITSLNIQVFVDAMEVENTTWTGELHPFQKVTGTTNPISLTAGSHTYQAVLSQPNGQTDAFQPNDTIEGTLFIDAGVDESTLILELNLDNFSEETGWSLEDDNGMTIDSALIGDYAGMDFEQIIKRFCLADGCYTLTIDDAFGDFSGLITLTETPNTELFNLQNNFTAPLEFDFCLPFTTDLPIAKFAANDSTICYGESIQFSDSSEQSPTSYLWTFENGTPATSSDADPLVTYTTAGEFDVQLIVSNSNGSDTLLAEQLITVFDTLMYSLSVPTTDPLACQDSALVYITPDDLSANYTFAWLDDANATLSENDSLYIYESGTYTYIVGDTNGCESTGNFELFLSDLEISFNITNAQCAGLDNGQLVANLTGGTDPISYEWSDTAITTEGTLTQTDLPPGDYTLTVTDGNGCVTEATATVGANLSLDFSVEVIPGTCAGVDDATINSSVSGGTAPYSYDWSFLGEDGQFLPNQDTVQLVPGGTHWVVVQDFNGCEHYQEFTVDDGYAYDLDIVVQHEYCENASDGSIYVTPVGGVAPYTFFWNNSLGTDSFLENISGALYTIEVTDSNGCVSHETINVETISEFTTSVDIINENCKDAEDGVISIQSISGGVGPFEVEWLNIDNEGFEADSLGQGDYYISITGTDGCSRIDTLTVQLETPLNSLFSASSGLVALDTDPTVEFFNLSTGALSYSWSFGDGNYSTEENPTHTYTQAGSHFVTLTVFNGFCSEEYTFEITVLNFIGLEENNQNFFSLSENPTAGVFELSLTNTAISSSFFELYDATGRQVHKQMIANTTTKVDVSHLAQGHYVLVLANDEGKIAKEKLIIE
ncbi:MAG: PKD domain-containing protein [Flavobacteriales bacterium]